MKCRQDLTCKEFEERYEVEMKMMLRLKDDDVILSSEFLPADCLARNRLELSLSSRTDG